MIIDSATTILRSHPEYLLLLSAYRERHELERQQQEAFDGWQSRINSLEGIEPALMSRIHGKLISLGLLKFELGDRLQGIRYQLSTEARHVFTRLDGSLDASSEDDDFEDAA